MVDSKNETAAHAAEGVKAKAAEATEAARDEAMKRAEGAKFSLAEEISSVASALKVASREFNDGSTESRAFGQVAESLSGASEAMRHKKLGDMVSDLNAFARHNPAAFLGGAALLGFAASRFARASSHAPSSADTQTAQSASQPSSSQPRSHPAAAEVSMPRATPPMPEAKP